MNARLSPRLTAGLAEGKDKPFRAMLLKVESWLVPFSHHALADARRHAELDFGEAGRALRRDATDVPAKRQRA